MTEVEAARGAMREGLLARLRGNVALPECLRIVGFLRRLAPFPEAQLRCQYVMRVGCKIED